jgi:hypothetical protein
MAPTMLGELRHVYMLPDVPRGILRGPGLYHRGLIPPPGPDSPPRYVRHAAADQAADGWADLFAHVARLVAQQPQLA